MTRTFQVSLVALVACAVGCAGDERRGEPAGEATSPSILLRGKTFQFEAPAHWEISGIDSERLRISSGSFMILLMLEPYLSTPDHKTAEMMCSREKVEADADELVSVTAENFARKVAGSDPAWNKDVAPEMTLLGGPTFSARRRIAVLDRTYTIDLHSRCAVAIDNGDEHWTVGQLLMSVQGIDGDIEREVSGISRLSETLSIVPKIWAPWPHAIP